MMFLFNTEGVPVLAWTGLLCGMVTALAGVEAGQATEPAASRMTGRLDIKCTCRANGRSYELGERTCLETPTGYHVAECRMAQNVTSWVLQADNCIVSARANDNPPISMGAASWVP